MRLAPPLLVIAGPTASGKTRLALSLARALGGELIGADSVQVYQGFDIGSAKPGSEELGAVRHHLLDVAPPDMHIDAARFAGLADAAIDDCWSRRKLPIVVGGSGLWLRALLRGLVQLPAPDPALRKALGEQLLKLGSPAMHARLTRIDPIAAAAIHPNDAIRIVRALEVHAQTGTPLGELRARHALGEDRYRTMRLALTLPRETLRARIALRTEGMLADGLLDEVRQLRTQHPHGCRAFGSVGYKQACAHLDGALSSTQVTPAITRATWVYAKQQINWLKSEPGRWWWSTPEEVLSHAGLSQLAGLLADLTHSSDSTDSEPGVRGP